MFSTTLRVKELLKECGWTTKTLSEKTGISESYLTHIKNGTRRWNEDALERISKALSKEPCEMFYSATKCKTKNDLPKVNWEEIKKTQKKVSEKILRIPVLSKLPSCCELNDIFISEAIKKGKSLPVLEIPHRYSFFYRIPNNRMLPTFSKGSYILISPSSNKEDDCIAVIEQNESGSTFVEIKSIAYSKNFITLRPVSDKGSTIFLNSKDQFKIVGKVVQYIQKF